MVTFVGALGDLRKGFDTVFEVWSRLAEDRAWPCDLAVVGSGADAPYWRRRLARAPWSSRVHFLGFSPDVASVLAASDAFLAPTRYEPYGLAAHEALCCGLATFITAAAGVAERIPPGLAGFLLPDPRDAAGIAGRLRAWWGERERFADAQRACADTLRRRSWDDMAAEILDVMEAAA